jgi:hypothetical protein
MDVRRSALGDGEPPAYVFASPCCEAPALLAAWIIEYAVARTGGRLLIECGRYGTDPLRPVAAARGPGCGRHYVVGLVPLRPDAAGRGALPQGSPRPVDTVRPGRNRGPASG